MYNYENSYVLKSRAGSIYASPNLGYEPISALYSLFSKVVLELSHPSSQVPLYLDMADVRLQLGAFGGTVKDWLTINGNNALPTTTEKPSLSLRYARYTELSRVGYDIFLGNEGLHYPADVDRAILHDVGVKRSGTDMTYVNNHSLMTVNGFIHHSTATTDSLYIRNGKHSAEKTNKYTSGMLTFGNIGKLTRYKIQRDNIRAFEADTPIANKLTFTVPELDIGKPFFLVLGGYLVFPEDGIFQRNDANSFTIDLWRLNLVERLLESVNFIDLTSLNIQVPNNMGGTGWFTEELLSEDVIKRYMTFDYSFLVTVDAPNLSVNRSTLMNEPYPGRFLVPNEPVNPIVGGHGRLLEYWPIETKIGWVIDCSDNYKRNFMYSERGHQPHKQVDGTEDITNRHRLSGAHSLEIFSSI